MNIIAETDRLIIRTWNPQADAEQAFYIYSDPEVTRFIITKVDSVESSQNLLKKWITKSQELNNGSGFWAILPKETEEIVGTIILIQLRDEDEQLTPNYEIGWHLKKSAWGKGYATEAAKAILDYGFKTLKLPVIYSIARSENTNSLRVIQRLGMTPVGRTTKYYKMELEMFKLANPM
ncbi:GNAT family N-acetyltransferase [Komarekiella sp. 'clone 1']|uniref:GNAT family N-acetyltransferase n=1 Tax=Komarekiella delphini-convector SJRDD-AB1 TaxID=2593771 RepID=A0AA40ST24_9NOST|nr:GNAT family N-acetyltransferase [Komarekiella delphini-convector]MBD6614756.1 GNAT family N-acetyltransferase [Komarekiella delphini-convector SJRDD-AB1]